jgi:thymidylate synthase (FAD)
MAQMSTSVQKIFRPVPNVGLRLVKNDDVKLFLESTTRQSIERSMTEFSARVCYDSVKKIGSAPNFVEKVLQSGHLSTAEHASLMLPVTALNSDGVSRFSALKMQKKNRFFDFPNGFIAGNMRCWLEYMADSEYNPLYEYVVAVFPDVFPSTSYVRIEELYEFADQAPINVPAHEGEDFNLYLLAHNAGETAVSRRPDTKLIAPWMRFTWLLEGVSRSLTHQLVRHRGASFSQESQRYVDFEKGNSGKNYGPFVYPEGASPEQKDKLFEAYRNSVEKYADLRKAGLRKEDARFVLPNAASTRLVVSFNTRELVHFLDLRCAKDAQWEIRRVAREMARQAFLTSPIQEFGGILEKHEIKV